MTRNEQAFIEVNIEVITKKKLFRNKIKNFEANIKFSKLINEIIANESFIRYCKKIRVNTVFLHPLIIMK